jgi:hypothetical protein
MSGFTCRYDKAGEGFIDQAGFRAVLSDLGLLEGK